MAGAPQQGGGQSDNSMEILWAVAAIFVVTGLVWIFFKEYIVISYLKVKLFEIGIVSHFTDKLDGLRTLILSVKNPSLYTFDDISKIGSLVGNYIRIPLVIIIFILAVLVYLGNSTRIYKRLYSMRELVQLEKVNWPQIMPVADLDLINTDIDKGPWAMALTPMQFCKRNQLLEERRGQPKEGMTRKEWDRLEVSLKRGMANKLFVVQLGPLWQGVDKLPMHTKALFAAFAARINADGKTTENLLAQLSRSSITKLDFTGVDELCKKYESTKLVQEVINSHAYVLTVMSQMLESAREDGVQASADFLWLKPVDRRLWYMLNTVGRQTPFVEAAGPYAHWIAEKEIGKKLIMPMIEEATNALDIALKSVIYNPEEQT